MTRATFVTFAMGLLAGLAVMPVYRSFQKPDADPAKTALTVKNELVTATAAQVPASSGVAAPLPTPAPLPEVNVLKIAAAFADGGGFNWDSGTGTPEEIKFKGQKILSKSRRGTYCCGFTFAVVMRAAGASGLLEGKSAEQIRAFQQHWYAATPKSREKQQIFALQWLGIGHEVPLLDAQPGDFIRLWHGSSGHSVIFVRWVLENGKKTGLEYRGTQSSTNGIGNRIEYLPGTPNHKHGDFDVARTYAGRLNTPERRTADSEGILNRQLQKSPRYQELQRVSPRPGYFVEHEAKNFLEVRIGDNFDDHFATWEYLRVWKNGQIEKLDLNSYVWKLDYCPFS